MNYSFIDNLELHTEVIRRIRELFVMASRLWPEKCGSLNLPVIRYSLKGKTAGRAWPLKWEISLNPLIAATSRGKFINEIVSHEIAHLIAYRLNDKDRPHGETWQRVMRAFGQAPERLHGFDVSGIATKRKPLERYAYSCKCREHHLSKIRHDRIRKGTVYKCRYCKDTLKPFSGKAGVRS